MHGFGYWKNFNTLVEQSNGIGKSDMIEVVDPAFEGTVDIAVPSLSRGSDKFVKGENKRKVIGSAGNSLLSQKAEPQMGSVDDDDVEVVEEFGGLGIKGALKGGLTEAFHSGEAVDNAAQERANNGVQDNTVDKIKDEKKLFQSIDDLWKDTWNESYNTKVKNKNYDFDATKLQPKYSVNINTGIPSMKRGW